MKVLTRPPLSNILAQSTIQNSRTTQAAIRLAVCEIPITTEKRAQAFEMRCYRRLLNISNKEHVINEDVRRKMQAAIGKYDELLSLVKKRKLRWFGHVSRSSGLAKTILQGTVEGKSRKGRQKRKKWEDNINEWRGMDFTSLISQLTTGLGGQGLL